MSQRYYFLDASSFCEFSNFLIMRKIVDKCHTKRVSTWYAYDSDPLYYTISWISCGIYYKGIDNIIYICVTNYLRFLWFRPCLEKFHLIHFEHSDEWYNLYLSFLNCSHQYWNNLAVVGLTSARSCWYQMKRYLSYDHFVSGWYFSCGMTIHSFRFH